MRWLSFDAAKLLVQAFISTRLDYCNSLMYGINDNLNRCLRAVQNAAACLITSTRRCEHITPVLQQMHWLPVRQRVRSPCWRSRHYTTSCRPTWRRTANWLLSLDVADCVRRTSTRTKFGEPTHGSAIARLPLRGHEHGTVWQSNCETPN